MIFHFSIPGRLAGANEMTDANRSHWSSGARLRKQELELCQAIILVAKSCQEHNFTRAVWVNFTWIEKDERRDLDNVAAAKKVILDALVRCGVLPNDTRRWVRRFIDDFPDVNPKNPRIDVVVMEIE